jgi:hypothetical protein
MTNTRHQVNWVLELVTNCIVVQALLPADHAWRHDHNARRKLDGVFNSK